MLITLNGISTSGKTTIEKILKINGVLPQPITLLDFSLQIPFGLYYTSAMEEYLKFRDELLFDILNGTVISDSYFRRFSIHNFFGRKCNSPTQIYNFVKKFCKKSSIPLEGLHFYLSIDYETYCERMYNREKMSPPFYQSLSSEWTEEDWFASDIYMEEYLSEMGLMQKIDARQSLDKVIDDISSQIRNYLTG